MKVRPISVTRLLPVAIPGIAADASPEDLIVYCARVSNPGNQTNLATGHRLLRYCMMHGHWSVFEMVDWMVEVETSRAIAAQLLRHRSFSFQEFSQRYSDVRKLPAWQRAEMRPANPGGNRQGSDEVEPLRQPTVVAEIVDRHLAVSLEVYERLIDEGVAPECARMILPLATTSRLYVKGSVRSWIHYLQVRCDSHAQKEHREVAEAIRDHFCHTFPTIGAMLKEDAL